MWTYKNRKLTVCKTAQCCVTVKSLVHLNVVLKMLVYKLFNKCYILCSSSNKNAVKSDKLHCHLNHQIYSWYLFLNILCAHQHHSNYVWHHWSFATSNLLSLITHVNCIMHIMFLIYLLILRSTATSDNSLRIYRIAFFTLLVKWLWNLYMHIAYHYAVLFMFAEWWQVSSNLSVVTMFL